MGRLCGSGGPVRRGCVGRLWEKKRAPGWGERGAEKGGQSNRTARLMLGSCAERGSRVELVLVLGDVLLGLGVLFRQGLVLDVQDLIEIPIGREAGTGGD